MALTEMSCTQELRFCRWCDGPIRPDARRDSIYCSQPCRQAAHRFYGPSRRAGGRRPVAPGPGRRFAYADPPYPGLARRYYGQHPDYGGEVDHAELVSRLTSTYDGWALSTSAAALRDAERRGAARRVAASRTPAGETASHGCS